MCGSMVCLGLIVLVLVNIGRCLWVVRKCCCGSVVGVVLMVR